MQRLIEAVDHANFGGEDDQAIFGDPVAARAQAIAVKGGANKIAIGEGHCCRTVPRLDHWRVVAVKRLRVGRHLGIAFPGRGHQHAQRVQHAATGALLVVEAKSVVSRMRISMNGALRLE